MYDINALASDIYDIWLPSWWQNPLFYLSAIFFCVLVAIIIIWYRNWSRIMYTKEETLDNFKKRELALLESWDCSTPYQQKEFYRKIVWCIKEYTLRKHLIDSQYVHSLTDTEFVEYIRSASTLVSSEYTAFIQEFFDRSAHRRFMPIEEERSVEQSIAWMRQLLDQ